MSDVQIKLGGNMNKQIAVKTKAWGNEFSSVSKLFQIRAEDKNSMNELRERNIQAYEKMREVDEGNYRELTESISDEIKCWLNQRIAESIEKLGTPPTEFSVFTAGSLARGEAGFITDLEIGFLVKDNSPIVQDYFQKLGQILSDRMFLLGEHPDVGGKGLRIDEADNAPVHKKFFHRYADDKATKKQFQEAILNRQKDGVPYEGSRVFIQTPEVLAKLFGHDKVQTVVDEQFKFYKKNKDKQFAEILKALKENPKNESLSEQELKIKAGYLVEQAYKPWASKEISVAEGFANLGRNLELIYGSDFLYKDFLEQREVYLNEKARNPVENFETRRQEIALEGMRKEIAKYLKLSDEDNFINNCTLGESIDLKRDLYRFPEQFLTSLGFYYKTTTQNTVGIALELFEIGVISESFKDKLIKLLNGVTEFRLLDQSILRKQGYEIYLDEECYQKEVKELQQEIDGLEKVYDYYKSTKATPKKIIEIENELVKKRIDLKSLEKVAPDKILSIEDKTKIEKEYLPLMKEVFEIAKLWTAGIEIQQCYDQVFEANKDSGEAQVQTDSESSEYWDIVLDLFTLIGEEYTTYHL